MSPAAVREAVQVRPTRCCPAVVALRAQCSEVLTCCKAYPCFAGSKTGVSGRRGSARNHGRAGSLAFLLHYVCDCCVLYAVETVTFLAHCAHRARKAPRGASPVPTHTPLLCLLADSTLASPRGSSLIAYWRSTRDFCTPARLPEFPVTGTSLLLRVNRCLHERPSQPAQSAHAASTSCACSGPARLPCFRRCVPGLGAALRQLTPVRLRLL
jgi:hypothetical protein